MTATLRWPKKSTWTDRTNDVGDVTGGQPFTAKQDDTVEIEDDDVVEHYLARGWEEVADADREDATDADVDVAPFQEAMDHVSDELPHEPPSQGVEIAALRKAWKHLVEQEAADGRTLKELSYDVGKLDRLHGAQRRWWRQASEVFALLPGVVAPSRRSGTWRYDPTVNDDRPDVPTDPVPPTEDTVNDLLNAYNWPGNDGDLIKAKHRGAVSRMYDDLQDRGEVAASELKEHAATDNFTNQTGHYDNAGDWFREVGRPALKTLPGVDAPRVAGDGWRFVGVESDPHASNI